MIKLLKITIYQLFLIYYSLSGIFSAVFCFRSEVVMYSCDYPCGMIYRVWLERQVLDANRKQIFFHALLIKILWFKPASYTLILSNGWQQIYTNIRINNICGW